jgi:hypothetical protein
VRNIEDDVVDIEPDPNYRHLIGYFRGNQPCMWHGMGTPAVMHCEAYSNPDISDHTNRWDRWRLGDKPPDQRFEVSTPDGTQRRELAIGDVVRVVGRWVIDHHPEYCSDPEAFTPPEPTRCSRRGALKVGLTHTELHPFDWQNIVLAEEYPPHIAVCTVSLAAPLYEQQYLGNWKCWANEIAGVAGKLFIDDTNFHETVQAAVQLRPSRPGPDVHGELKWEEAVFTLGEGMDLDSTRRVVAGPDGIDVHVEVRAEAAPREGPLARWLPRARPSIHDPARNRSVFQARYIAQWVVARDHVTCAGPDRPLGTRAAASTRDLDSIGGVLADGQAWRYTREQAVAALRAGHRFYVLDAAGNRCEVVLGGDGGQPYATTAEGGDVDSPLLFLPGCPTGFM